MAVIAVFIGTVNYFVLDALESIARSQILAAIESSAKAFERYETGRKDLYRTRVAAMSEAAHLKATLSIPGVDSETARYAGVSLREISDMPVILLLDGGGMPLADVNDYGVQSGQIASVPGIDQVFKRGETINAVSVLGNHHVRLAIAPVISGGNLVGAVLIGEPLGTSQDIESMTDLSSVSVGLLLNGTFSYPGESELEFDVAESLAALPADSGESAAGMTEELLTSDGPYFVRAVPLSRAAVALFYVSRNTFSAPIDNVRNAVLAASLLVLLLGSLLSLRVASRISRPIRKLTCAVESFGKGHFDPGLIIDSNDEVGTLATSFTSMAYDIENKQQELLASKEAAEASSRAKGVFLATMSHEIRTPLNGVIGMVELLHLSSLSPKQRHYCDTISSSSRSLLRILNDILDLTKIDAGHFEIDAVDADLTGLVRDTVNLFVHEAASKELGLCCDAQLPENLVHVDKVRIGQVLTNLVSNAIKFTKAGGVDVSARAINRDDASITVRFEIVDTGIGMNPETLERVFEPFSQADGSMSRRFGGTGLGLSISKRIVELLGGQLLAESSLNEGSRFWFDLCMPVRPVPLEALNSPTGLISDSSADIGPAGSGQKLFRFEGLTALLAEDNLVNQEVTRESLGLIGIDVVIANNGKEAVRIFDTLQPSFVLMDCQMPEMDGHAATRAIRQAEAEKTTPTHTPVIALTANTLSGDREKCLASGMDDFIGKPFELKDLQDALLPWFEESITEQEVSVGISDSTETKIESAATLDRAVLASLREIGQSSGTNLVENVISIYLKQAPDLIDQIGNAIANNDCSQLSNAAHTLKSSSANVGARHLAEQSDSLETAARHGYVEESINITSLQESFESVAALLQAELSEGNSIDEINPPASNKNAEYILVVDDDESFRLTISEALIAAGFTVEAVSCGSQAEDSAKERRPDLMLLDALMPDVDGFEVCRKFGNSPRLANIPILMVTGLDDRASVDRAFESGASGFVTKPIQYAVLGHQIRFVIRANETAMELASSEQRLTTAQRIASLGYWMWNVETGDFAISDDLAALITDTKVTSLENIESAICPEYRDAFRADIDRVVNDRSAAESTFQLRAPDESTKYIHQYLSIEPDTCGELVIVAAVQDVTARRVAEEQVRYLAFYDTLTGLASRTRLYERIDEMIKSARRRKDEFAVLFLDLDGFKDVNDSLGHSEGDALLKVVADRLTESFRENDFIARFGGDEFCIILEDISDGLDINQIVTRCLDTIGAEVQLGTHSVQPRASIGIARYPSDGEDMNTLLMAADSAMYEAKANGKHRFEYFDSTMAIQAEHRFVLAQELRNAFDNDEFELYFQPQISLRSGQIAGYEALVRWNHPTRGQVPPGDFVPELERLGLINDLGDWVISKACEQISLWRTGDNIEPRVCVNIAATHFQRKSLVNTVQRALAEFNIHPTKLELEVTETALQYSELTIEVLSMLKEIGVSIAIDDFGSGYSSLGSLQHLPVDSLKIDRMFVRDLMTNPKDAVLLGTIMTLAHALGFQVVAEGVESREQVQVLDSLDCDLAQGFYFSKPLQARDVPAFAKDEHVSQTGSAQLKVVN